MPEANQTWHFRWQPIEQHSTNTDQKRALYVVSLIGCRASAVFNSRFTWLSGFWSMCMKSCNQQRRQGICGPAQENYTFVRQLGWTFIFLPSFISTFPASEKEKFEGALNSLFVLPGGSISWKWSTWAVATQQGAFVGSQRPLQDVPRYNRRADHFFLVLHVKNEPGKINK